MKAVDGAGILSNFFTFRNGGQLANKEWEEIDIEIFGRSKKIGNKNVPASSWKSNIIEKTDSKGKPTKKGPPEGTPEGSKFSKEHKIDQTFRRKKKHTSGPNKGKFIKRNGKFVYENVKFNNNTSYSSGFTTFRIDWKKGDIRWFENGKQRRKVTGSITDRIDAKSSLRFNIWASSNEGFAGKFDCNFDSGKKQQTRTMEVDFIKYWALKNGKFPATSTKPTFEDSFSKFDSKKWNKADYTFGDNYTRFIKDHATTSKGKLRLLFKRGFTADNGDDPDENRNKTGCGNSGSKKVLSQNVNSLSEADTVSAISVTSFNGGVYVSTNSDTAKGGNVTIFDIMGRQISSVEIVDGQSFIDLSANAKGIYIVRTTTDNGETDTTKISL